MATMDFTTFISGKLVDVTEAGNLIVNQPRVGYQLGATMKAECESLPTPTPPSRAECWQMGLLLTGFFVFNLLTAARYPFVWIDEGCIPTPP